MFKKILIANRGEIACRIIKTANVMGIKTVAIYSDADRNALHVKMADEAIYIGESPSIKSYLVIDTIIQAALRSGAEAIHPGYGFLSENAEFCTQCDLNNIVFIGPTASSISAMGSKSAAKNIMADAHVPLVPGYHGTDQNPDILKQAAADLGYPVLIKAAAGGGGKGMRTVTHADQFDEALSAAKREAMNSFNNDIMLIERYFLGARHIEIQVFCDRHDNAVYLFERDCSLQRRHQKVIEEAPAPGLSQELRKQMGEAALRAAKAISYEGAGTVEFLLDKNGDFFFMEMNTRLQVEHPITEMIIGQDLVEWQFRVAYGEHLPRSQDQLSINGHAFEARIYAEDPEHEFLPSTGTLRILKAPLETKHVRVDTGVAQGDEISIYYDPMIAKLIVWDVDRATALKRLTKALSDYRINGVATNVCFLYNLATIEDFRNGHVDTSFIEKHKEGIFQRSNEDLYYAANLAAKAILSMRTQKASAKAKESTDGNSPWHMLNGWRANGENIQTLHIAVGNKIIDIQINNSESDSQTKIVEDPQGFNLFTPRGVFFCSELKPDLGLDDDNNRGGSLAAPMNGTIVSILVELGAKVEKGETLLVMEAMKMEHAIIAPYDALVTEFFYQPGELVNGGAELLSLEVSVK